MNAELISQLIVKASGTNHADITPDERRFATAFAALIAEECAKIAEGEDLGSGSAEDAEARVIARFIRSEFKALGRSQ